MTSKTSTSAEPAKITPLTEMTVDEVASDLTGFEELAIRAKFNATIGQLNVGSDYSLTRRALIFTLFARQENGPKDAFKAAMSIKIGDLDAHFGADEGEEPMPDEPVTAAGKDDSLPE